MSIRVAIDHLKGVISEVIPLTMEKIPFIQAESSRALKAMAGAQDRRFTLKPSALPQDNGDSGGKTQIAELELEVIYKDSEEGLLCASEDTTLLAAALRDPANFGRPTTTIINVEPKEAHVYSVEEGRRGLSMSLTFDLIYSESIS